MTARIHKPVNPIAYQRAQAAAALGMGLTTFDDQVRPHVRCVYVNGMRLYPHAELERWVEDNLC